MAAAPADMRSDTEPRTDLTELALAVFPLGLAVAYWIATFAAG